MTEVVLPVENSNTESPEQDSNAVAEPTRLESLSVYLKRREIKLKEGVINIRTGHSTLKITRTFSGRATL
jgi:hypothetical protein